MTLPPVPDFPQDAATAYHEAGHAVMALIHERPVLKVNILPSGERLGVCKFQKGVQRPSNDWLEAELLIALAGLAAEARFTGIYDEGGAGRDLQSVRKLSLMRTSDRSVERFEKRMLAKAENVFGDDRVWAAVERIALELLKYGVLSGRAVRHHYEEATKAE